MTGHKPWDMIVREVMALDMDELQAEAWAWFEMFEASDEGRDIVRSDLEVALERIHANGSGALALQQVRGWCAHRREVHCGRSPYELDD